MTDTNNKTKTLDNISIYISGFCLIHSLAFPVLSASIPVYGFFTENHFHEVLLFFIIPISSFALYRGFIDAGGGSDGILWGLAMILGFQVFCNLPAAFVFIFISAYLDHLDYNIFVNFIWICIL